MTSLLLLFQLHLWTVLLQKIRQTGIIRHTCHMGGS
ncbi:hypothetical protein CsSME_00007635 [Camellia sinensis var. sinensis]